MKLSRLCLILAVIAALVLLLSGPGSRFDWWEFRTGFQMMRYAAYGGLAAAGLAVLFLLIPRIRRGQVGVLALALVAGLVTAAIPWQGLQKARSVPPIHDITTDTDNPPEFEAVLPLRGDDANPVDYTDPEVPRQQREAYPDIQPLEIGLPPDEAFTHALTAGESMGWEIVATDPGRGRLEATATTFWFGFRDDVVVRITPIESGSRIDVRSTSRVGRSDVGANAERIRKYFAEFRRLAG